MEQSRRLLYAQRAEKYLKLFANIAQNKQEENFVRLVALQRVLDEKLKQLFEDARIDEATSAERKRTAAELAQVNKKIDLLQEQRQRKALYDLLIKKAEHDQFEKDYWLSRVGKVIAMSYVITQVIIMIFLGVLVLFAFGTAPWLLGIVIPTMFVGSALTGVSNWWLFRGLTPKTLIALRKMLLIETDVSLTLEQKIKLSGMLIFCIICGFMASYGFYILLIEMTPVALALLNLTGLAVIAAGFPWLVPLIMFLLVLPVFINGAIAVVTYFFRSLHAPIVRGKIWADMWEYCLVMIEYDLKKIEQRLNELEENAFKHYGQYYTGKDLYLKIKDEFDDGIIYTILIKKFEKLKQGKSIKWQGRLTLIFTVIFMFGMLCGIVVSQFLGRANLSAALSWAHGLAELLSGLICVIAGLTYINVIISGGAKCIVDIAYGVEKTEGEEKTEFEKIKFQTVRSGNSSMNTFEAAAAFILKSVDNIKDFAFAAGDIIKSGWDLSIGLFCTVSAGLASFLTNSIQGKPTTYEEDLEEKQKEYQDTKIHFHKWRQEGSIVDAKEQELKPLLVTYWQAKQVENIQKSKATNGWFSSIIPSFSLRGF